MVNSCIKFARDISSVIIRDLERLTYILHKCSPYKAHLSSRQNKFCIVCSSVKRCAMLT